MIGSRGHRRWRAGARIASVFAAGLVAVVLHAQEPLTLYVSATDASGKPVTDLKAEEIAMSENGVAGKVIAAEKFSLPIHLTIGLDNGPGSDQARGFYKNGLDGLVKALPEDVEVSIIAMAPQPRVVVKSTANRDAILKGITQVAPDSENSARFTDTLVEYSQRLDKESQAAKDKKLGYAPYLMIVSTTAAEASSYQIPAIEKAMAAFAKAGARLSVAMTTSRNAASLNQRSGTASVGGGTSASDDVQDLNNGRQALIAIPLTKQTQGKYEALAQPSALQNLLPEWGKMIAAIHTKQVNQYKLTIQRPNGVTGPLNNLDMRFTRQGLNGSISGDGRYSQ
jgi:hypothetical protein